MQGQLLNYSIQENVGYISGDDGKRYRFAGSEWKENRNPQRGDKLDFDVNPAGEAISVFFTLNQNAAMNQSAFSNSDLQTVYETEANYTVFDWFWKCMRKYASFSGRARRKEFWYFYLCYGLLAFIVGFVGAMLEMDNSSVDVVVDIIVLVLFLPSLAVSVRRLHDINRSGWWYLLSLIPVIGIIILIIWWIYDTKPETNQWGPPAKPNRD